MVEMTASDRRKVIKDYHTQALELDRERRAFENRFASKLSGGSPEVLRILWLVEKYPKSTASSIAYRLEMSGEVAKVTALITFMEKRGLAVKQPRESKGGPRVITLTEKGKNFLEKEPGS